MNKLRYLRTLDGKIRLQIYYKYSSITNCDLWDDVNYDLIPVVNEQKKTNSIGVCPNCMEETATKIYGVCGVCYVKKYG